MGAVSQKFDVRIDGILYEFVIIGRYVLAVRTNPDSQIPFREKGYAISDVRTALIWKALGRCEGECCRHYGMQRFLQCFNRRWIVGCRITRGTLAGEPEG